MYHGQEDLHRLTHLGFSLKLTLMDMSCPYRVVYATENRYKTLLYSPYFDSFILSAADESLPIPTESKATHRIVISYQCVKFVTCMDVPEFDGLVIAASTC